MVFYSVTLCSFTDDHHRFGRTYRHYLQGITPDYFGYAFLRWLQKLFVSAPSSRKNPWIWKLYICCDFLPTFWRNVSLPYSGYTSWRRSAEMVVTIYKTKFHHIPGQTIPMIRIQLISTLSFPSKRTTPFRPSLATYLTYSQKAYKSENRLLRSQL